MTKYIFWLIIWLIFCFILFVAYIIFKVFDRLNQDLWINKIKSKHLLIRISKKFKKQHGEKISYTEFKKIIDTTDFNDLLERPAWFELFDREKIVFFEIPWGEVYCECSENEYDEIIRDIDRKFQQIQK